MNKRQILAKRSVASMLQCLRNAGLTDTTNLFVVEAFNGDSIVRDGGSFDRLDNAFDAAAQSLAEHYGVALS